LTLFSATIEFIANLLALHHLIAFTKNLGSCRILYPNSQNNFARRLV